MTFSGFGPDATAFLSGLKKDNSRQFFEAHRQDYVNAIRQPLEDLLGEAEVSYGPGRVMRPNRDVRFSANKAPYKTNASIWAGSVAGVYLSVTAEHLEVGGGLYSPSRDQLERARTAIDSVPLASSRLDEIVEALVSTGFELAGPFLATAPRGYARDHPSIELLRLKHYAALTTLPVTASPEMIRDAWHSVEELIAWVDRYVKGSQQGS